MRNLVATVANDGSESYSPPFRGKATIVFTGTFASATVTAKQFGVQLKDTGGNNVSTSAAARFVVDGIVDHENLVFAATGGNGTTDITVQVFPENPGADDLE